MPDFETLLYEENDGVAWVTLSRPDVHNAFNAKMAHELHCGGTFYMLGGVEFIIAAERATFFDPHVTYGMTAAFEPMHMLQKMPFQEIMRLSLLGNDERLSAGMGTNADSIQEGQKAFASGDRPKWRLR